MPTLTIAASEVEQPTCRVEIKPVSYVEILDAPNAAVLLNGYAKECVVDEPEPQRQMYELMEKTGKLRCFGAYVATELIGFVSVLVGPMPHHGKWLATIESLYVEPAHRDYGTGNALLTAAEEVAIESGCVVLLYTARVGSSLETILSRRVGCERSHVVFSRWL